MVEEGDDRLTTKHSARRRRTGTQRESARARDAAGVVRSLRRLFKAIHEYSKAVHGRTGLSGPQLWALTILDAEPGISLGRLADRMFAHPSTVSGIVDRLVDRRAVTRTVDREDRRGIRLSLTPLGRRLLRRSPPPVQAGLSRSLDSMPAAHLRRLRTSLERVARETETDRIEAPFFDLE
ncbi:MAG: MarR family transcriptional regulator [Acidobacteria bacterium]|nr:MarR family transcriptional regulator [Acidobacteriota bacterium]